MRKFAWWSFAAALMVVAPVGASAAPPEGQQGPRELTPEMRQRMLQRFDANGNGQLDPDEMQAARAAREQSGAPGNAPGGNQPRLSQEEVLKRFDQNKNGKLDPAEQQAARAAMQRMQPSGGGQPGMSQQEILKRFDKNNNGQLDPDEQQAARAAMQQRRGPGDSGKPGAPGDGKPPRRPNADNKN